MIAYIIENKKFASIYYGEIDQSEPGSKLNSVYDSIL